MKIIPEPPAKEPKDMEAAVRGKCSADDVLTEINEQLSRLRRLKREWGKRYRLCVGAITKFAVANRPAATSRE